MEKHAYLSINSSLCFYHFMPTFSSFYAYVFLKKHLGFELFNNM